MNHPRWDIVKSNSAASNKSHERLGAVFLSLPILACLVGGLAWGGGKGGAELLVHLAKAIAGQRVDAEVFWHAARLMRTGMLHPDLVPYIFPADYGPAAEYWHGGGGWPGWGSFPRLKSPGEAAKLSTALMSAGLLARCGRGGAGAMLCVPMLLPVATLALSGCYVRQELSPWKFDIRLASPPPPLILPLVSVYMSLEGHDTGDVWEHSDGLACV